MSRGEMRIEMAVSAVVPVLPPSILIFATMGGDSAAAEEAAALELSSLALRFGGIVGGTSAHYHRWRSF